MNVTAFFPRSLGATASETTAPNTEGGPISLTIHKNPRPDAIGEPTMLPPQVLGEGEARRAGELS